jgi:GGDEF domain-containing protein
VVLSEHITGAQDAIVIAERILDTLRTPFPVDGEEITLSASIGICLAPVEGPPRGAARQRRSCDVPRQGRRAGRYVVADDDEA